MTLAEEIAAKLREANGGNTQAPSTPQVQVVNTESLQVKSGAGF